jgi:hypothetical protein
VNILLYCNRLINVILPRSSNLPVWTMYPCFRKGCSHVAGICRNFSFRTISAEMTVFVLCGRRCVWFDFDVRHGLRYGSILLEAIRVLTGAFLFGNLLMLFRFFCDMLYSQWGLIPRPSGRLELVILTKNGSRPHS